MQRKGVREQHEENAMPTMPDDSQHSKEEPMTEKVGDNIQEIVGKAEQEVERTRLPWYHSAKRAYTLIGIYAIVFVIFGLLAWWVHFHPVLAIDVTITQEFQENQNPWLSGFMFAVSWLGYQFILYTALIVVTAIIFWILRLRLEAVFIIAVSVVSSLLNGLIKVIVERPRPSSHLVDILSVAGGQSFPSGHVMAYVAFFGSLFSFGIILFKRDRWWHYLILIIPGAFVVLVGPSRIYLGDHWASDVLGAYILGGALLGISLYVYLKLRERGVLSRPVRRKESQLNLSHKR